MARMSDPPARPDRATITTIAARTGVSTSTVSRALRADPRITPATRALVEKAAAELAYRPNALARTLQTGRSGLVGLVLGSLANPFYGELLQEVVRQAAERETRMLILHAGAGPMEERTAEALLHYRVDACMISSAAISSVAADVCADNGVPVIMLNRIADRHAAAVACDNASAGRELASFLVRGGHSRIGIVAGSPEASTARDRERGFTAELARLGQPVALRMDAGGGEAGVTTYEAGHRAGRSLAQMPPAGRPDAVMCISDILALGVMDALREAGLHIPRDISVVGFDGIAEGARPPYRLTTVRQPIEAMVTHGFDWLARLRAGDMAGGTVLLPGELLVRGSARLPA